MSLQRGQMAPAGKSHSVDGFPGCPPDYLPCLMVDSLPQTGLLQEQGLPSHCVYHDPLQDQYRRLVQGAGKRIGAPCDVTTHSRPAHYAAVAFRGVSAGLMTREMMCFVQARAEAEVGRTDSHSGEFARKDVHSLAPMHGLAPTRDHLVGNASHAGGSCVLN